MVGPEPPPRAGSTATDAGGSRPLLVAAFDKFRGTASAEALNDAAASAAVAAGWTVRSLAMADGGEGLLDSLGGEPRTAVVTGPLGEPVEAEWRLIEPGDPAGVRVGVVEMARASGLALVGGPEHNDPEAATTRGTGELVLEALRAGARRIVVGCGGSATTDGGSGALEVLAGRPELASATLVVACDVTTTFADAARVFAPQKGADPAAVERLSARLTALERAYRDRFGCDLATRPGSGAAGGLAGALAALGGRLVPGFELVADAYDLDGVLGSAALVVTGEGRLDETSLAGKVVGGVLEHAAGRAPVLVVVGNATVAAAEHVASLADLVVLTDRFGPTRSLAEPAALVGAVVAEHLRARDAHRDRAWPDRAR